MYSYRAPQSNGGCLTSLNCAMTNELPPQWEKLKILGTLVATLGIPLVLALVANSFSKDQKELEIGVKYVELATQILREKPTPETKGLRSWAIATVDHYSRVPLTKEAKNDLEFQQLKAEMQNLSQRQQLVSNILNEMHTTAMEAMRTSR